VKCDFFRLLLLLGALYLIWRYATPKKKAALALNEVGFFSQRRSLARALFFVNPLLFWLAACFLLVALSNPRALPSGVFQERKSPPREGIGIYFLLDRSGSMEETVPSQVGAIRKIDLAKKAIEEFAKKQQNDLLGLVAFSRIADVLCPLTLDVPVFLSRLSSVEPITDDRFNGTAIGYAIYKTVHTIDATKHFAEKHKEVQKSVYSIKNQVIIIVTDGLQSPHPDDRQNRFRSMLLDEAFAYAKQHKTRIYFIGVDPIFAQPEFASDVKAMRQEIAAAGGAFFLANEELPIDDVLSKIDALEKSQFFTQEKAMPQGASLMPFFVSLAMGVLFIAICLETIFLKVVP
jgi:Ca-activated chloride channel family protein